jgi:hypothetical protein
MMRKIRRRRRKDVRRNNLFKRKVLNTFLHLCAFEMRMATLLFADENAPEWAFSKRKGVK